MDWQMVLLALMGLLGLYLVATFFITPFKYLCRLVGYMVLGTVFLFLVNLGGSVFGFHIAINPITVLTAGILQVPGVVLLILLKLFVI
ncbi:MAG: pro-sigmaK processing inhibitor BofA family protein [Peptococcaceae bacterium]|nr:pro-sigmaK processing inhibitor BofA family protein [Peptococcaceae bacterium]